ncbi:MAG: hypothetical protein JW809_06350 [Pirellulales bacterium]|nr:hypothetical protein [Pirellulales bacterium]
MTQKTYWIAASVFVGMMLAGSGRPARGQILFDKIEPRKPALTEIAPKGFRAEPYRTESMPSKPYAPMPHFHNRNILPDRMHLAPINKDDIRPSHMRPDRITFNPLIQVNITPEPIHMRHMVRAMSPGHRMTEPATPPLPTWAFNPEMERASRPTTRFDSSIKAPLPDYDAPNRQRVVVPPGKHPMSW